MQSLFLKVSIIVTHFSSEEIKCPTWVHLISPSLAISQSNIYQDESLLELLFIYLACVFKGLI